MTRPAALPVLTPAVIPVTDVAMIIVRQERLKTTRVLMLLQPNAVPAATGVKTARPAKLIGTVLMSVLPNAAAVIPVPIPVLPVPVAAQAVLPAMTRFMSGRPNAETAVMDVKSIIILIPARQDIDLLAVLVLTDMRQLPNLVPVVQLPEPAINARLNPLSRLIRG